MRALVALLLVRNHSSQVSCALGVFPDLNFTLFEAKIKYKTPFDPVLKSEYGFLLYTCAFSNSQRGSKESTG